MLLFFLLVRFGVFLLVHLEVDPAVPSAFAATAAPSASTCILYALGRMLLDISTIQKDQFFTEVDPAVPSAFAATAAPSSSSCAFWRMIKCSIMNTCSRIFDH
ncbi:hypothetical protein F2Q69_00055572 [Brassica cretica]|uniref:Secreted protein n=1 Tax=Brassica cretica TaxID=69181 RepID=A0A8S9N2L7_BRACR|nr:hypothetical protein F2Q69_00055572 [Brassica cretica]